MAFCLKSSAIFRRMEAKDQKRLEQQLEDRTHKLWSYVRRYQNSLCAELHQRRIRELVETPLPMFVYQLRQVNSELEKSRESKERLRSQIANLKAENAELRRRAIA